MLVEPWRVILLGQLKAEQTDAAITRFRTRKAASLFAYLACHLTRSHAREELADRFWPDDAPETARAKLRLALASLRHQLEPLGVPSGAVLFADRTHVRLDSRAVETDVTAFETKLREAQATQDVRERLRLFKNAVERYGGDLLPGDYEEWALQERERLRQGYVTALTQVVALSEAQADFPEAISYAHRLVQADPLEEQAYVALIRLYLQAGRPNDASQTYSDLIAALKQAFDCPPGEEAQALAAALPAVLQQTGDVGKSRSGVKTARARALGSAASSSADRLRPDLSPPLPSDRTQTRRGDVAPSGAAPSKHPASAATPASISFDLRLPLFLTRFFGRTEAVRALVALLDGDPENQEGMGETNAAQLTTAPLFTQNDGGAPTRLITLTGPGGAGKTRLAVETARFLQSYVTYPIAFVGLAEVTDAEQILRSVADALHLPHRSHTDLLPHIADRLQTAPALLILDNFEQLPPSGASVVQTLLTRLPALRCLVTSRHHLGLPGERTVAVAPLPVPASQQLFLDRAQAARPDFQITPTNSQAVAMLCEQLEGIPLALELAAAWIGVLTPAQMLARMNRRFDLLVSRRDDRVPRHRALHATIAWSCELLSPELQTFLMRMSVFRGGWDEQAAQEIGSARHALHLLAQLRERSLVVSEESENGDFMRFHLLESVREFAEAQMDDAAREEVHRIHAAYYLRLAEEADQKIAGPEQARWFALLEPEQPNIRAALDWLAGGPESVEAQLRLTVAMRLFWRTQGHLAEARQRLEEALAREEAEACRSVFGLAVVEVGLVASMQGDQETARAYAQRALEIARRDSHPSVEASALNTLGNAAKRLGEYEAARDLYTQSREISRKILDQRSEATAIANLGNVAHEQGDYARAAACYEESLQVYRRLQNRQGLVIQLYNLASLNVQTDDYIRAAPLLTECLALCREVGDTPTIMHVLEVFGMIADEFAQPESALELYAAAARLRKQLGLPMSPRGQSYMEEMLAASRARMGSAAFDRLWQSGTEAPLEQTILLAGKIQVPAEVLLPNQREQAP